MQRFVYAVVMPWNYKRYGTASDPIHKSHLNNIIGEYGCPRKFQYQMDALADRKPGSDELENVSGKAAAGTAAHETIARALTSPELRTHLLKGGTITRARVLDVFTEEYGRELGERQAMWYGKDTGKDAELLGDRVDMILGLLNELHKYVAEVLLVEPGFVAKHGDHWLCGHVDLVYRPTCAPDRIAITDWKTGAHKPLAIELDHGWEAGVYSAAVHRGYFIPREQINVTYSDDGAVARIGRHSVKHKSRYIAEREVLERQLIDLAEGIEAAHVAGKSGLELPDGLEVRTFGEFPCRIHHVHMADYVPYRKAGKKEVKRPEDLAHYGFERPRTYNFTAGERRGPAWLPVKLSEYDLPRLASRLRRVVGMIRMGFFVDQVGDRCLHCSYAGDCLTSGYGPTGEAKKAIDRTLRTLDRIEGDDGTSGLSVDD